MYHEGQRELQDLAGSRDLADRLRDTLQRDAFNDGDKAFVEESPFFFLATADASGQPDCSFKGGLPGFARILSPDLLVFPDYDGNGMFRSLGNVLVNASVGLLFIDFERARRLRVNGEATVSDDDPLMGTFEGAQLVVRVRALRIFPNCPRYIHDGRDGEVSPYAPRAGHVPPVPAWKRFDAFRDVLAANDPAPIRALAPHLIPRVMARATHG